MHVPQLQAQSPAGKLVAACFEGNVSKVAALIGDGVSPDTTVCAGVNGSAVYIWAPAAAIASSQAGAPECLRLLIDSKIDPDYLRCFHGGKKATLVTFACQQGNHHAVQVLLATGGGGLPRNRAAGDALSSPLTEACRAGAAKCVRLLLDAGHQVSEPGEQQGASPSSAPLDVAISGMQLSDAELKQRRSKRSGARQCAQALLEWLHAKDAELFAELCAAQLWRWCGEGLAAHSAPEHVVHIVELLLSAKADPNRPHCMPEAGNVQIMTIGKDISDPSLKRMMDEMKQMAAPASPLQR